MRNLKKILALVLSLMMVLSVMVTASAADYSDADEITNTEAVDVLSTLGILSGSQGKFAPKGTLTRAQAAKILAFIKLGYSTDDLLEGTGSDQFTDVTGGWAYDYVSYCANEGIISGSQGKFFPNAEVTGYQFGKMALVAAGIEGKYTNSGWELRVATALKDNGLKAGIEDIVLSAPITREQAAQMALNAMLHTDSADKYAVYDKDGKFVSKFDTLVEAALYASTLNQGNAAGKPYTADVYKDTSKSLISTVFGVTYKENDTDDFARPAVSYYKRGVIDATYTTEADMSYTAGFNTAAYNALVKAGYNFDNAKIYVNGVEDNSITDVAALASRAYTGTTIELYNTDATAATIEKVVVVQSYLTKVVSVVSGYKDPIRNAITLAVYNPWHASNVVNVTYHDDTSAIPSVYDYLVASYKANDFFQSYWAGADVAADHILGWDDVTTASVTVSSTKMTGESDGFNGTFVASGTTYTVASGYAEATGVGGALALGKDYTLYLDSNGYVLGAVPVTATAATWNYGIVLDYGKGNGVDENNVSGAPAQDPFERVQILTSEGKTVIYDTAFTLQADGLTVVPVADASTKGKLVKYTLNANGAISKIEAATATSALAGTYNKGTAIKITADGNYASDSTVFFVSATKGVKTTYSVYVGYNKLPSATYTAGKAFNSEIGGAGAVFVSSGESLPSSTTTAQYAVVTDSTPTVTAGATAGTYVYTWTAIVDGKETTISAGSDVVGNNANKLCTITFNATTGAVATLDPVTTLHNDKIVSKNAGFYVDGAVVYTDSKTVYYQVTCANTNSLTQGNVLGFEQVSDFALAGLGETFEVYETFVVGGTISDPAKVVFFYVYQP